MDGNLIYYYPSQAGAPSTVGRSLFDALTKKNIDFNLLVIPQSKKENYKLRKEKENINLISVKELLYLKKGIIHFSVDPQIFPNKKFLIYLLNLTKHHKLIVNYHGEPRTEFEIMLENHDMSCLFNLPTYTLMLPLLKSANVIVLNSYIMKNLFVSKYNLNNVRVIPNGINSFWFDSETKDSYKVDIKRTSEENINLFYHGRLAPEKGIDILLFALSIVLKRQESICKTNSITLYIVGDGPQRKYLKDLSSSLEIEENVIFLGKVPLETLKFYLQSVDAAIYPSIYEPFSLAVLEALSSVNGPVMYSDNTGLNDFVKRDGYTFYTFKPNVEDIANSIENVIQRRYDVNVYKEQKNFSRKYTWDNIADKYLSLYREYLSKS